MDAASREFPVSEDDDRETKWQILAATARSQGEQRNGQVNVTELNVENAKHAQQSEVDHLCKGGGANTVVGDQDQDT